MHEPVRITLWLPPPRAPVQAPKWFNRDRFVLSAGHGSMLNYSLLHLMGYESVGVSELVEGGASVASQRPTACGNGGTAALVGSLAACRTAVRTAVLPSMDERRSPALQPVAHPPSTPTRPLPPAPRVPD